MLESNYLTMLMKPNYEKPVDSAEDIIERGLTALTGPSFGSIVEMMKNSPYPITKALAEKMETPKVISYFIIVVMIYLFILIKFIERIGMILMTREPIKVKKSPN